MKTLNLKINKCNDCPYCIHDKWLYGFVCHAMNEPCRIANEDNKKIEIPKECPLPDLK
jgi:hypothetical protein